MLQRLSNTCWARRDYLDLPLVRHGHESLLPRVIALRNNLTACDATYVALAENLGATLATSDTALRNVLSRLALVPLLTPG
jgi:predicted nucleic acid-binding protein